MANLTASLFPLSDNTTDYIEFDSENETVSSAIPIANTSMSQFDAGIELLANTLYTYYTPLLVLLGSIGNIISIYVFFSSKLRIHSTSLYLSVLAISDTIFLTMLLPPWMNAMQLSHLFLRAGFCEVIVYSSYTSCCCSAWLVVSFTVERFVAVLYPFRRSQMCTVARAKGVIAVLVVCSMAVNLPVLKYVSPSANECNIAKEYIDMAARFNVADTMLSFTLPLGLIMLLNSRIVSKVWRRGRERRAMQAAAIVHPYPYLATPLRALPPIRSQQRVTSMLLVVSSVFVVLNVPAYTVRIAAYAFDMNALEYSGRWAALQQLALTFFNTNFGINFILYCLSGQNFRRELCVSVPCLRNFRTRVDELQLHSRVIGRARSVDSIEISVDVPPSFRSTSSSPSPPAQAQFEEATELEGPDMCLDCIKPQRSSYDCAHEAGVSFTIDHQPRRGEWQPQPYSERRAINENNNSEIRQFPTIIRRNFRTLPAPEEIEMTSAGLEDSRAGCLATIHGEQKPSPAKYGTARARFTTRSGTDNARSPTILNPNRSMFNLPELIPRSTEEEGERPVNYLFFPFKRLLVSKAHKSNSISSDAPSN